MNKIGASNKFFFYNQHSKATFNIRFRLIFKNDLNLDAMKEAANEALERYPEFGGKITIKDNKLVMEENSREIAFYKDDNSQRNLGSDDTNGYLFYFLYGKDYLIFSYYHGMTDIVGAMTYLKTVFYLYGLKIGFEFDNEQLEVLLSQIREKDEWKSLDPGELYAPYEKYGNINSVPEWTYENPGAYSIPTDQYPEDCDYTHAFMIELSTSEFIKKTKELKVSVVPLMVDIISGAIRKEYPSVERPVIAMVPVSLRPFYESNTLVNFSDGIMIPYTKEDESLSHEERCLNMKAFMKRQMTKENFDLVIGNKVKAVEAFEGDNEPMIELATKRAKLAPKDAIRPLTYAMTYPGKIDFTDAINPMIKDFFMEPLMRAYATVGYTYGDKMRLFVLCRNEESTFADCILEAFKATNFEVKMTDCGHVYADQVNLNRMI